MKDITAEELARVFHESYERLAVGFGYDTRPHTRVFDPESPNGKLMIAVSAEILNMLRALPDYPLDRQETPVKPDRQLRVQQPHE